MDVADFLELEGTLHRQWIIRAAAKVEHVTRRRDEVRHCRNVFVMRQRRIQGSGRFDQMAHNLAFFFCSQLAFDARKMCRKRREHRKLAGEGLSRRNADFGASMCRQQ